MLFRAKRFPNTPKDDETPRKENKLALGYHATHLNHSFQSIPEQRTLDNSCSFQKIHVRQYFFKYHFNNPQMQMFLTQGRRQNKGVYREQYFRAKSI